MSRLQSNISKAEKHLKALADKHSLRYLPSKVSGKSHSTYIKLADFNVPSGEAPVYFTVRVSDHKYPHYEQPNAVDFWEASKKPISTALITKRLNTWLSLPYEDRLFFGSAMGRQRESGKQRNPSGTNGMLMGKLTEIVVRKNGIDRTLKPKGLFVGWILKGKHIAVLKKTTKKYKASNVGPSVKKLHKKFHNADSTKSSVYEWPDPVGRKENIGRIVSLTYTVPSWLRSPGKNGYQWHHEFGDRGERGHGDVRESGNYPQKYMPMLQKDSKGNYYIKRMPGNKYYVTDWLYW